MSVFAFFYTTTPDVNVGRQIAQSLVEAKLAACVNLIPHITSFYCWENKMQEQAECILLIKSKSSLSPQIQEKILSMHPYDCPAILQLPIEQGAADFLKWAENALKKEKEE